MRQPFRFCPRCGSPLRAARDGDGQRRLMCPACGYVLYRNSKPCAGALIVQDERVLLVRRAGPPFQGWWDIPGGFLEPGEHPEAGALREVREETGLDVRLTGLLGMFVDRYRHRGITDPVLNIFYLAEPCGGNLRAGSDALTPRWFAPESLPRRIGFAANRAALTRWRERSEGTTGR